MLPTGRDSRFREFQSLNTELPKRGVWEWLKGMWSSFTSLFHSKVTPVSSQSKYTRIEPNPSFDSKNCPVSTKKPPSVTDLHAKAAPKKEEEGGGFHPLDWMNKQLQAASDYLDGDGSTEEQPFEDLLKKEEKKSSAKTENTSTSKQAAKTKDALNERGNKINELQDKTSKMEDEAVNFADLSKKLREQQQNKKWWEF